MKVYMLVDEYGISLSCVFSSEALAVAFKEKRIAQEREVARLDYAMFREDTLYPELMTPSSIELFSVLYEGSFKDGVLTEAGRKVVEEQSQLLERGESLFTFRRIESEKWEVVEVEVQSSLDD